MTLLDHLLRDAGDELDRLSAEWAEAEHSDRQPLRRQRRRRGPALAAAGLAVAAATGLVLMDRLPDRAGPNLAGPSTAASPTTSMAPHVLPENLPYEVLASPPPGYELATAYHGSFGKDFEPPVVLLGWRSGPDAPMAYVSVERTSLDMAAPPDADEISDGEVTGWIGRFGDWTNSQFHVKGRRLSIHAFTPDIPIEDMTILAAATTGEGDNVVFAGDEPPAPFVELARQQVDAIGNVASYQGPDESSIAYGVSTDIPLDHYPSDSVVIVSRASVAGLSAVVLEYTIEGQDGRQLWWRDRDGLWRMFSSSSPEGPMPLPQMVTLAATARPATSDEVALFTDTTGGQDPEIAPSTPVPANELFAAPPSEIEWSVIRPESSISEADITSIAWGPAGFVAVGMGFDPPLDRGQGRVWFSETGDVWTEVEPDLFAPQGISSVAATSRAYYLYATPTPPTEGSTALPSQLYRSANGTDWEPVGEPSTTSAGPLFAIGDSLVRVAGQDGGIDVSIDGETWAPADLVLDTGEAATGAVHFDHIVQSAGSWYARGLSDDGADAIWTTRDGAGWTQVPMPDIPGRIVGTPDALLSFGVRGDAACAAALDPDAEVDDVLAAQRNCRHVPIGETLDTESATWSSIGASPALVSPTFPGVAAFANQLVAVVATRDGTASIWISTDGATWTRAPVEARWFEGDPMMQGSPDAFWVSGQNESTIVIPISSHGVGDEGSLIVGHVVP